MWAGSRASSLSCSSGSALAARALIRSKTFVDRVFLQMVMAGMARVSLADRTTHSGKKGLEEEARRTTRRSR